MLWKVLSSGLGEYRICWFIVITWCTFVPCCREFSWKGLLIVRVYFWGVGGRKEYIYVKERYWYFLRDTSDDIVSSAFSADTQQILSITLYNWVCKMYCSCRHSMMLEFDGIHSCWDRRWGIRSIGRIISMIHRKKDNWGWLALCSITRGLMQTIPDASQSDPNHFLLMMTFLA